MVGDLVVRALVVVPIGLAVGSFMTVVTERVPAGGSVVRPRSRCPRCGTPIAARDNVPVVSWMLRRGRCRACGEPISPTYPLIEISTAALIAGAFLRVEDLGYAIAVAVLLALLPAVTLIDVRRRIIPNRIVYPALALEAAYLVGARLLGAQVDLFRASLGFLALGGGFLLVALIAPGQFGMGDVKLGALIGLVLGASGLDRALVAAGSGIVLGGVFGLLALMSGRGRKTKVPYGPFLAAGAVVAVFWGPQIATRYLDLLR
jgi:leader peptidase (prepilin peptidase) / N-methyltransferase